MQATGNANGALRENCHELELGGIMAITIDDIEALRRQLAELPRNQPREVTKQEAIALLSTELGAAGRRGYSHEELARLLSENGIAINVATLRGYLRRTRKSRRRRGGKTTAGEASTATSAQQGRDTSASASSTSPALAAAPARSAAVRTQHGPAPRTTGKPTTTNARTSGTTSTSTSTVRRSG